MHDETCEGFEIYFHDLKEKVQQELLDFYGIESPEDMNWDVFPVAIIPCLEEEVND